MKKLLSIAAVLMVLFVGCSEQTSINAPVNNVNTNEPNWIKLPQSEGMNVEQSFSVSKSINGSNGGTIYLNKTYTATSGNSVTIKATAKISAGTFSGTKVLTLTVDDTECTIKISPDITFNKPITCDVEYSGIDFTNLNTSTVKFVYTAYDGTVQYAQNSGITTDSSTGTLKLTGGTITINSRYGFVN
jgi:hypothetical protein